jgi:hypothetical protein
MRGTYLDTLGRDTRTARESVTLGWYRRIFHWLKLGREARVDHKSSRRRERIDMADELFRQRVCECTCEGCASRRMRVLLVVGAEERVGVRYVDRKLDPLVRVPGARDSETIGLGESVEGLESS